LQITCKLLANYLQITCKLLANYKPLALSLCLACLLSFGAVAQSQKVYNNNGSIALLLLDKPEEQLSVVNPQAVFKKYLNPDEAVSFVLIDDQLTEEGHRHQKFQQYYHHILVEHGVYSLHTAHGKVYALSGEFYPVTKLVTSPALTEKEALQKTLTQIGAEKYAWQDTTAENMLKEHQANPQATHYPKGNLVIWHQSSSDNKTKETYHLAYKFSIKTIAPKTNSATYYVSAATGQILNTLPNSCQFEGDGLTTYNGVRRIQSTQLGTNSFILKDPIRNIQTRRIGEGFLTNDSNDWLSTDKVQKAGISAHWGVTVTHDYFLNTYNRNGYDGAGATITNNVNYAGEGASHDSGVLTFGKTKPTTAGQRTYAALDVVAHEWAHALCWKTSNSLYSGESGAINESLSDIWGNVVEHNTLSSYPFSGGWLLGEDVEWGGVRDMSNPKSKGNPDTYQGVNWGYSVHNNSGVMNHWFYMLCQGKTGTNDKRNSYNVVAIGMEKAARITYRTERDYLLANDGYVMMANKSLLATRELFGWCSQEYESVWNAWYAAGVFNTPYIPPAVRLVDFHAIVCNPNQTYNFEVRVPDHLSDAPLPNVHYRWQLAVGRNLVINNSAVPVITTTNQATLSFIADFGNTNFNGYWETLTVTALDCSKITPISYTFWVGKPDVIGELSSVSVCENYSNTLAVNEVAGTETYTWYVHPTEATIDHSYNNYLNITPQRNAKNVSLWLMVSNRCSNPRSDTEDKYQITYRWKVFNLPVDRGENCNGMCNNPEFPCIFFVGYPNPVSNVYTISLKDDSKTRNLPLNFTYQIYNSLGISLLAGEGTSHQESKIDVSTWADGFYTVHLQSGEKTYYLKFVVQKGSVAN
jgi:bacillolysin